MVDIAEAATRKIGPLPAWAWGAVVGGGFLVYRAVSGGPKTASSPFVQPIAGGTPIDFGSGGGGGGSTTAPTPPPKTYTWASNVPDSIRKLFDVNKVGALMEAAGFAPGSSIDIYELRRFYPDIESIKTAIPKTSPTPAPAPAPTSGGLSAPTTGTREIQERTTGDTGRFAMPTPIGSVTVPPLSVPSLPSVALFGATGDTEAAYPPTLGLPISRVEAVNAARAANVAASRFPVPDVAAIGPAIPATFAGAASAPRLIDTGADTYPDFLRGLRTRAAWATRRGFRPVPPPTTTARRLVAPASARALVERFRPTSG
jgi:hypothetical protein